MEAPVQYFIDQATLWTPKIIGVVVIFVVFFVLAKMMKRIIRGAAKRLEFDGNITVLLVRANGVAFMVFGFITVLGTLGIDITALVAGLGLTGFALGFALKDTISNLLSGVLILLYRPFEKGNHIKISGYEGIVVSIDLRYTELDSEGDKVLIPNSKLFSDPVTVLH
ncbi:MAG TPA: mechanosensitive ion channel [Acidiferrobacteraceae bacterium]|nr:mechanosensitive ion channel [Acidiferrobacteraceae bacterium]